MLNISFLSKNKIKTIRLAIFLSAFWVTFFGAVGSVQAASPTIFFTDMTDGPIAGWEESATKGAAVSVYGFNLGAIAPTSKITACGQDITSTDSEYVGEWGATTNPVTPHLDAATQVQRISFHLKSSMTTGQGTISITTEDGMSASLPFYCRNNGTDMFFYSFTGNDSNNGLYATQRSGTNGPKRTLGLLKRNLGAGDIAYIHGGTWNEPDTIDDYNGTAILDFWSSYQTAQGQANNTITVKAFPGDNVLLDSTPNGQPTIWRHGSSGHIMNYWNWSNLSFNAGTRALLWNLDAGSSEHIRIVGNDATSAMAEGKSIFTFYAIVGDFHMLGNYLHDAGVDTRGQTADADAYGFAFSGGSLASTAWVTDRVYVGWNESCYHTGGHAFYLFGHRFDDRLNHMYMHDNYFHHNSMGGSILGGGDTGGGDGTYSYIMNLWYYNNVVTDNAGSGVSVGGGGANSAKDGGNFWLYNNTIKNNGRGWSVRGDELFTNNTYLVFTNNIVVEEDGDECDNTYYSVDSRTTGENNIFYQCSNVPNWGNDHTVANPKFVGGSPYSYQLQSDSPAIGMGTVLNSLFTTDMKGIIRGAEWDIGAFEYASSELDIISPGSPTGLAVF